MRWVIVFAATVALSACSTANELPHTSSSDPVWQLNPGKWAMGENDLIQPAGERQ